MSIMRVDASPGAEFKAAFYLAGKLETRYFESETAAFAWLDGALTAQEDAGRLWRVAAPTATGWRVRNLFGAEGLILGIVIACSSQFRNPSVDVVLSEEVGCRQKRVLSFGHKRSFAEAFTHACLLFVRHHQLTLVHLRQMLQTADAYLDYYQLQHYRNPEELSAAVETTLTIFEQGLPLRIAPTDP